MLDIRNNKYSFFNGIGWTIYSNIAFYLILIAKFNNNNNNFISDLYNICCCNNFGILTSFHFGYVLDSTSFNRMAKDKNINIYIFNIGNIIFHYIPCLINIYIPPSNITIKHSIISILLWFIWLSNVTNLTYDLSSVYTKFPLYHWYYMYIVLILTNIGISFI